ncbi:MAG: CPBP family intramembrane metalloprotease [Candidatus Helarchaeota archaeon]|nr:CPBP family intramembrane metalloprotease [Candidatus Helarchaeota archaeon]
MSNFLNSNDKEITLTWKVSIILWLHLLIIQIFIFSAITVYILEISGWIFNEFLLINGSTVGVWLSVFITEIGTLIISLVFLRYLLKKRTGIEEITGIKDFNLKNNLLGLGFVPLLIFTGIFISNLQAFFFDYSTQNFIYDIIFRPKNYWELIIWIIIMFTIVGPVEEIVFRGIIQKGFQNKFREIGKPEWHTVFLSSLLFSIFHLDLLTLIPIFFMGILLGLVYYLTDSSMVCAITHGAYDAVTIILIFFL